MVKLTNYDQVIKLFHKQVHLRTSIEKYIKSEFKYFNIFDREGIKYNIQQKFKQEYPYFYTQNGQFGLKLHIFDFIFNKIISCYTPPSKDICQLHQCKANIKKKFTEILINSIKQEKYKTYSQLIKSQNPKQTFTQIFNYLSQFAKANNNVQLYNYFGINQGKIKQQIQNYLKGIFLKYPITTFIFKQTQSMLNQENITVNFPQIYPDNFLCVSKYTPANPNMEQLYNNIEKSQQNMMQMLCIYKLLQLAFNTISSILNNYYSNLSNYFDFLIKEDYYMKKKMQWIVNYENLQQNFLITTSQKFITNYYQQQLKKNDLQFWQMLKQNERHNKPYYFDDTAKQHFLIEHEKYLISLIINSYVSNQLKQEQLQMKKADLLQKYLIVSQHQGAKQEPFALKKIVQLKQLYTMTNQKIIQKNIKAKTKLIRIKNNLLILINQQKMQKQVKKTQLIKILLNFGLMH